MKVSTSGVNALAQGCESQCFNMSCKEAFSGFGVRNCGSEVMKLPGG